MKKIFLISVAAIASMAFPGISQADDITLCTGAESGVYYAAGQEIAKMGSTVLMVGWVSMMRCSGSGRP